MDDLQNIKIWSVIGFISGAASLLNHSINKSTPIFNWAHVFVRGIVGLCVGTTFAWVVNLKLGYDWAVPASSVGAWFSSETMLILEKWLIKRINKLE